MDRWIDALGLNERENEEYPYTFFTLEAHICYLKEATEGEILTVFLQVIDRVNKRIHLILTMKNEGNERVATSEQMVMGMNRSTHRPAPFPKPMQKSLEEYHRAQQDLAVPKEVGRKIGIRRK